MKKLSAWLYRISKGWVALFAVAIFFLFMFTVLPDQAAKAEAYAQGAGSPDTSFFYRPEALFEIAEAYGQEGREAYVRARFTFDLAFPLVYGGFLAFTISWFLGKSLAEDSRWRLFNLTPVLGVIFDLLENIAASLVIGLYPQRLAAVAWLASVFTLVKWIFVYGSFVVLLAAIVVWLVKMVKRQPK